MDPPLIETTIEELTAQNPYAIMNTRYKCRATIRGLPSHNKWWYLVYILCKKQSLAHGDSYKCTKCPNKTAEPRYKLAVEAIDDTDESTYVVEFIFFGDVAEELTGKTAAMLVSSEHGPSEPIPKEISVLFGRTYILKSTVSRCSFHRDSISFQVTRIHPQPEPMLQPRQNIDPPDGTSSSQKKGAIYSRQHYKVLFTTRNCLPLGNR